MSGITAIDFFCGAGGSSTGLVAAGVEVIHAANHDEIAIDTHRTNHPKTEHSLDDLQQSHASRYPRTDIAWFSPECTNHSRAKGKKRKNIDQRDLWGNNQVDPEEERSRATMREVVEFTAFHKYLAVIVENVVDITLWAHYNEWLRSMVNLGYDYKVCFLNAQFFGVPQSRDRIYIVFWRKGIKAPNLDFMPPAHCPRCGEVAAVQAMKPSSKTPMKKYGKRNQYVYCCPSCYQEVRPYYSPASDAIDWTMPAPRIGDRKYPLEPKTMDRIAAGLKKLKARTMVIDTSYSHAGHNGKVKPVTEPLPSQTTRESQALITPFTLAIRGTATAQAVDDPMLTVTAQDNNGLVVPSIYSYYGQTVNLSGVENPLPSVMPSPHHYLLNAPVLFTNRFNNNMQPVDEPMSAITTGNGQYLLDPAELVTLRNSTPSRAPTEPLPTIESGGLHHGLLVAPWLLTIRQSMQARGVDEPLSTVSAGGNNHALIYNYFNSDALRNVSQPLDTLTTKERHALIDPNIAIEDCGFRMLQPHELKLAQGFPASYIVKGTKEKQVWQIGNAVPCPMAYALVVRVMESLEKSA